MSVTKSDGEAFRQTTASRLREMLKGLKLNPNLRTDVLVEGFDDDLYDNEDAARALDENGAPAQDIHPAWHLLYGVISIYRVGDEVRDEQRLFECGDAQPPQRPRSGE